MCKKEEHKVRNRIEKGIKAQIILDILSKNPTIALGGSGALEMQGFKKTSNKSDIDFSVGKETTIFVPANWEKIVIDDSEYMRLLHQYEYKGVKIDFLQKGENDIFVEVDGISVVSIDTIMEWKELYCAVASSLETIIKHQSDLNAYYKGNNSK